jgi:hypothetical protein
MGECADLTPVAHVAGNAVKVVCKLNCEFDPVVTSRNLTVPAPVGLRIASQYLVPDTTLVLGTTTEFHVPLTGEAIFPWVKRFWGLLLPESEYKPTKICVAALVLST